jgi:general secretion pathway protein E
MNAPALPFHQAREKGVVVAGTRDGVLELAVREDASPQTLIEARRVFGRPLHITRHSRSEFETLLERTYQTREGVAADIVDDLGRSEDLQQLIQDIPRIADLMELQDDAPIVRLINAVLTEAIRERASDVHLEAQETQSVVRLRLDGRMRELLSLERGLHAAMISRIKVMAQLDIAEKRLPQDGRISLRVAGREIDVRVSTLPTNHGERAVLRLLDKSSGPMRLDAIGMDAPLRARFAELLARPHGIVLVTGPTGSGKTTTLYAALAEISRSTRNIMTVEDPVEYEMPGISQTQANPRIEMDFARALRAILRQDPDVILIGEIRDLETAQIAVRASLTGHLVLATLHTNDAPSAITRLIDMGVEPFLLASGLQGVLAQRLVRRLCPACKAPGREGDVATGCPACRDSGYAGRIGVFELLTLTPQLQSAIHDTLPEDALRQAARQAGMQSLREDALRWVEAGVTSLDEVLQNT